MRLLYPTLMMLTALFTACAYDDGYEEMTLTNDEAREIVDRCYYQCDSLDAVDLPFDLVAIGDYAFFGSSVTSVVIPSEVTFIGVSAFNFCPNLTSLQVDGRNPVFDSRNNCNAIIRTGEDLLVYGCRTTVIPQTVRALADYAFCGCEGLGQLVLPDNVEALGDGAFYECSGLTSVVLSAGLQQISNLAFSECHDLVSVVIPQSVRSIGDGAFLHCGSLAEVRVESITPPQCGYVAFFNTNATLYVPRGTLDAYASAPGWRDFSNIMEI